MDRRRERLTCLSELQDRDAEVGIEADIDTNVDVDGEWNVSANHHITRMRRLIMVIAGMVLSLAVSGVFNPIWALEGQDVPTDSNPEEEIIEWDIRQNNGATMVEDALLLEDEIRVTLQGKIVGQIDQHHYRFKDATGEITIVLDEQDGNGLKVTSKDTLLLQGEIKKPSFQAPIVYVDFLLKLE